MVEKHKSRQAVLGMYNYILLFNYRICLDSIMEYIKRHNMIIKTEDQKKQVFKWLEISLNYYQDNGL